MAASLCHTNQDVIVAVLNWNDFVAHYWVVISTEEKERGLHVLESVVAGCIVLIMRSVSETLNGQDNSVDILIESVDFVDILSYDSFWVVFGIHIVNLFYYGYGHLTTEGA